MKLKRLIIENKYHFDVGLMFMGFVNLSLLVIAASEKIQSIFDISVIWLLIIFMPLSLFGTWLFGYFLDKIGFQNKYNEATYERMPQINEILKIVKRLENDRTDGSRKRT